MSSPIRLLWTAEPASSLQGVALAREGGRLLAWDSRNGLFLYDERGQLITKRSAPAELVSACCSADGSSFAAIAATGLVYSLDKDLSPRWERAIPKGLAIAIDSFGDRLAAADAAGGLHLFDGEGKELWHTTCPRPLRFLTFVAEVAVVIGSADFGLVVCCDGLGRILWRDAPVTHTGSLTASGDGAVVALARYSEGLCCYSVRQSQARTLRATIPCRLADVSYDGKIFLTAGLDDRVCLRDASGNAMMRWEMPSRPAALALSARGERAAVALTNGTIHMLTTRED
jgi:hypothetical protein